MYSVATRCSRKAKVRIHLKLKFLLGLTKPFQRRILLMTEFLVDYTGSW